MSHSPTKNPSEVLVTIDHPFGPIDVPLAEWMATGPGDRPLVRPIAAKDRATGGPLPLSVVPLRYRNNGLSRLLIRLHLVPNPWPASRPPGT